MKWSPHFILSIFIINFIMTMTRRLEELRFKYIGRNKIIVKRKMFKEVLLTLGRHCTYGSKYYILK